MPRVRSFQITEGQLKQYKNRNAHFCASQSCEKEIKAGDLVVSNRSSSGKMRLYCKKCALELNIIVQLSNKETNVPVKNI